MTSRCRIIITWMKDCYEIKQLHVLHEMEEGLFQTKIKRRLTGLKSESVCGYTVYDVRIG